MFKNPYYLVVSIVVLICLLIIGLLSSRFLGDDNKVEEDIEDIIKSNYNIDLDLTPSSKEKS